MLQYLCNAPVIDVHDVYKLLITLFKVILAVLIKVAIETVQCFKFIEKKWIEEKQEQLSNVSEQNTSQGEPNKKGRRQMKRPPNQRGRCL